MRCFSFDSVRIFSGPRCMSYSYIFFFAEIFLQVERGRFCSRQVQGAKADANGRRDPLTPIGQQCSVGQQPVCATAGAVNGSLGRLHGWRWFSAVAITDCRIDACSRSSCDLCSPCPGKPCPLCCPGPGCGTKVRERDSEKEGRASDWPRCEDGRRKRRKRKTRRKRGREEVCHLPALSLKGILSLHAYAHSPKRSTAVRSRKPGEHCMDPKNTTCKQGICCIYEWKSIIGL